MSWHFHDDLEDEKLPSLFIQFLVKDGEETVTKLLEVNSRQVGSIAVMVLQERERGSGRMEWKGESVKGRLEKRIYVDIQDLVFVFLPKNLVVSVIVKLVSEYKMLIRGLNLNLFKTGSLQYTVSYGLVSKELICHFIQHYHLVLGWAGSLILWLFPHASLGGLQELKDLSHRGEGNT